MKYIAHRVNSREQLEHTPSHYGVEIDLRDRGDRLILQHDPFSDGENFDEWLRSYRHGTIILNVKSERIEHRVLDVLARHSIDDYFFLDCSFPMIRTLVRAGEHKIAIRFSEFEPIENCLALEGLVKWVWVDCFTKMPLTDSLYERLKKSFQLCAVSPELQGRPITTIRDYAHALLPFPMDAICTKRPDLWIDAHVALSRHAA